MHKLSQVPRRRQLRMQRSIRNGSRPAQSTTLPEPRSCNKWRPRRSRGPSVRIGNLCRSMKSLSGIKTRSSASSFTGRPFLFQHMGMSGIPGTCTSRAVTRTNTRLRLTARLTKFGYKDFIPMFKAEHFDAHAWAVLFRQSGAKYVVPVFEHHDGFAMYNSGLSDWTVVKMGPRRDVYGDLAKEVRSEGCILEHRLIALSTTGLWMAFTKQPTEASDPKFADFYGPAHHATENHDALNFPRIFERRVFERLAGSQCRDRAEIPSRHHVVRLVDRKP